MVPRRPTCVSALDLTALITAAIWTLGTNDKGVLHCNDHSSNVQVWH